MLNEENLYPIELISVCRKRNEEVHTSSAHPFPSTRILSKSLIEFRFVLERSDALDRNDGGPMLIVMPVPETLREFVVGASVESDACLAEFAGECWC